jgi:3-oxoadipate enol-lactonase
MDMTQTSTRLRCYETGDPNKPTVVLLHGAAGLHGLWQPQLEPLSQTYHVIAPDLLYDDLKQLTISNLAQDVAALIRQHSAKPAHIVGLSFGALVATQIAIAAPDVVCSLVISAGRVKADYADKVIRFILGLVPENRLTGGFINATREIYPALSSESEAEMWRVGKAGFLASLRAISEVDFRAGLPSIHAPTLVLVGAEDRREFLLEAVTLSQSIPGARFQIIPDVGHGWNLEEPELFTRTVSEFVEQVENGKDTLS